MSRKGNKFDLAHIVQAGVVQDGETLFFVSDPAKAGAVTKTPNGDYKLDCEGDVVSIHAAAQKFLGQEPPNHASQWLRNGGGKTLYQLWQNQTAEE
jgi:hypothetical protein